MLLPDDIVNKEFSRAKRGYDIDEVEDYIALLLEKYDTLCRENIELEKNLKSVLTVLESRKKSDTAASELLDAAKKESDRIIAEAMAKADKIKNTVVVGQAVEEDLELSEIRERIAGSRQEYTRLREEIDTFKLKLYDMYSQHITMIEQLPLPDADRTSETTRTQTDDTDTKRCDAEMLRSRIKDSEIHEKKVQPQPTPETAPEKKPDVTWVPPTKDTVKLPDDSESSIKYGLNIVREPLKGRPNKENAEISAADEGEEKSGQSTEVFPLKFMSRENEKRKKW